VATLGTAPLDQCAARPGAHAAPKSVFALAASFVRLIGAFHDEVVPELGK